MPDPLTVPSGTSIEIERRPTRYPTFDAVVILRGEHDMASAGSIDRALGTVAGNILVDLSYCTFCDSSVVRVLFAADHSRRLEDQRIELLVPDRNGAIARIFQITGLDGRVTIHHGAEAVSADGSRAIPT
jgi:anti-anti-sigma factor